MLINGRHFKYKEISNQKHRSITAVSISLDTLGSIVSTKLFRKQIRGLFTHDVPLHM